MKNVLVTISAHLQVAYEFGAGGGGPARDDRRGAFVTALANSLSRRLRRLLRERPPGEKRARKEMD